jgi:hypothetical protein
VWLCSEQLDIVHDNIKLKVMQHIYIFKFFLLSRFQFHIFLSMLCLEKEHQYGRYNDINAEN